MTADFAAAKTRNNYKKAARKLYRRLNEAALAGDSSQLPQRRRQFLSSFAARNVAVAEVAERKRRRLTPAQIEKVAQTLDPRREPSETVRLTFERKKDGTYRPIHHFGLQRTALQRLLAHAIYAEHGVNSGQYGVPGKDRTSAIKRLKAGIADKPWIVHADIKDCFGSIDPTEAASRLKVPKPFRHILLPPGEEHLHIDFPQEFPQGKVGQGCTQGRLPQGSAASPITAAVMLAPVFDGLPSNIEAVGYVDDVALACASYEDAVTARDTLLGALKEHQAGPLCTKFANVLHATEGFRFLGYKLWAEDSAVYASPAMDKFEDLEAKVQNARFSGSCGDEEMRELVRGWLNAFCEWTPEEAGLVHLFNIAQPELPSHVLDALLDHALVSSGDQPLQNHLGL